MTIMMKNIHKFFVISSVVINYVSCEYDYPYHLPPPPPCIHGHVPVYIWCILGVISILLILVSFLLGLVLVKTKYLHKWNICRKRKFTPAPAKVEEGSQTQAWQNKSMRRQNSDKNDGEQKMDIENKQTLRRQHSTLTIKNEINTMLAPKKAEGSGGISPRILKNVARDMPIILPEQMSQICREVLNRKNKNDDSKTSLQNIELLVNEGKSEGKTDLKYASTPDLDLYDVALTPQSPKKISTDKSIPTVEKTASTKQESTENTVVTDKNSTRSSEKLVNQQYPGCDVYDFPKEVNSNALGVSDIYDLPKSDIYDLPKHDQYDLPKQPSPTQLKQTNYTVAYFPTANESGSFKKLEDKPKYALLKEVEVSPSTSKENVANNKSESEQSINPYEHYEIPITCCEEETKLYINANDNLFAT